MTTKLATFLRVGGVFGLAGLAAGLARPSPPENDIGALARTLAEAAGGNVDQKDIRWEPSGGMLADAMGGRFVLFLASGENGARDVWRARVRVSPEGRPLELCEAHNLTETPLGDDHALVARGRFAAFATLAYGQEQSVTLLDLEGEGAQNKAQSLAERAMACITNVQRTGSCAGIGRVDVTFEKAARHVGLALGDNALAIDAADEVASAGKSGFSVRHATLDLAKGELSSAPDGMHAQAGEHLPKRLSHWAVDTVRAVPWIGPAPIAWLEEKVFALKDDAKRAAFKLHGGGDENELAGGAQAPAAVLDSSEASIESAHWPPPRIPTIWKTPEAGEGEWTTPSIPWMRKQASLGADAPSPFYRAFLRPDEERPYAKVLLVAMDTRQLDFEMEAGSEDPRPLTGPTGPGKLPRDPAITSKVVAAFNGCFKTEHGYYGMMVHKRVLLPPQPGAASVVTLSDGRVGLGTWGANKTVSGLKDVPDDALVSMRQNLDALVDNGQMNPSGRSLWGYSAPGKGVQTERSGLCVTQAGHLMYAWGDDVSATTLAKAMKMAGCDYGMHLDMNPFHTGFLFTRIEDIKTKSYKAELLTSGMEIPTQRYIEWAPKDFFYVMLRDPTPPGTDGGSSWKPDGGAQPAPSWMPGIWSSHVETSQGAVELLDVENGRASFRVRAGTDDARTAAAARELSGDDAKRALFAVGMGVSDAKHARGLVTDGKTAVPMRGGNAQETAPWGAIVVSNGKLAIARASDVPADATDAAELPLVLWDNNAMTTDGSARAVLGTTPEGRTMIARGASEASLVDALKRAGCTRAVALDRGSHPAPMLHRAGLANAPLARYDETVLYAIATPMKPRAFRFEALQPAPTKK